MPLADLEAALQRVRDGHSTVELIHTPSPRWPYPPSLPNSFPPSHATLPISVLDSSFNPPTLAHLALAAAPPPTSATSSPYVARLLLLSVRNADKQLKAGDAVYAQRMHMMVLLAAELEDALGSAVNVAVAIIDEPTFVGKSAALLNFLHGRLAEMDSGETEAGRTLPGVQLAFLQGFDTIERLLAPRYYGSEGKMHAALSKFFSRDGDDSSVVYARRSASLPDPREQHERTVLEPAEEYLRSGKIALIDIDEEVQRFSSTEARAKAKTGDGSWTRVVPKRIAEYIVEQGLYRN
ncbi:Nucleotidylyl transferase [Auriscalpium vulgare]|uniref:Nucleotidylyl transferase n=1 Tax=Auriscalpium vulgare TaxID=40419 RepID=A0ACB8RJU3_9AGAM|nr:Nucleotidylyl transferase [Auriscalpium vulgare]